MHRYSNRANVHHFIYQLIISLVCFGLSSCASFYGSSFISLPLQDSKSSTVISFRFKTYQSDAILFLAVGPIDYCLITLEKTQISVRINLGSGEAVLTSKDLKLNDLNWHRIDVQRTDAELSLVVDELHTYFFDIPGKFFELNIKYGLFLGGLGDFKEVYLGELHNYRGCLEKVFYNGIEVIESASKTNNAHHITYECSNEFDASPSDAITFIDSGSYAVLPGFASSVRNGGTLSFDIKTSSSIAVLFFNEGSGGHHSDFIAIEIIDGKILLSINNGDGMVVLQSDVVVANGFWHTVNIQFSSVFLEISIDDFPSRSLRPSLGDNKYFDLNDQLFVGGIELNKQSIAYKHGLQSILSEGPDSSLKGCIKNIKFGQKLIGLRDAQITRGIKSGACLWEFNCLVYTTSPCVDGAECLQEGLNEFRCLCDSAVCVRPNFTSDHKLYDAKQDNEDITDSQILQLQSLRIAEGSSALITHNLINVLIDYKKYGITANEVIFRIEKPPKHGTLEVEVWDRTMDPNLSNSISLSDNVFTYNDLITEKIRYTSDGSENRNDSIGFLLEFNTRFFHLPAFMHSINFTFLIEIHPINDAPIISQNSTVLKLSKNSKRIITTDNLRAEDEDNSPEEIRYKINAIINGDQSFIENIKNIDIPIESFTQNDINKGLIRFVHKTKSSNNKNKIKALFTITDRNGETAETTLTVQVFDIELSLVNNTGISLAYHSFGLISATNLSYKTNSETDLSSLSQYIKFEIIKESQIGSIQKLRANGFWANVSSFTQRQINRNKIRYFHFKDKPNEDQIELQVSYNDIKAPVIRFQIKFKKSKLETIALNQLTITQDIQNITITGQDLKFDTQPYPTDPNLIIYTILSKPSFGSLLLISGNTTEELNIGSLVTQQMINDLKLLFNCSDKQNQNHKNHDSFDFEVATEGGLTNVEVTSFHFKFIRSKTDDYILTNNKLVVLEGDRSTINNKILKVETINKVGSIHYNITNKPKYGTIKLLNSQLNDVIQVSPNIVTEEEINQNRVVYYHDDSEHNRDIFDFEVFDSQNNFICFGTFVIEVVMKNDNPPIRVVDKVFEVVIDGQKRLTADDIKYVDADIDSSPADIKYSKTYVPNGNLYFVDRPNEMVEQFTQQDIDNEKIVFKHSGDESGRSILWISDGQFYASGVLEVRASKPYLRVSHNTGLVVKYGESGLISTKNLTIDTNLDITRKSEITVKITSEPKFGNILNGGKETNRFTLEDLMDESIEYESKSIEESSHILQDWFTFRQDYLSSRVTAENQMFNISIYPHSYFYLSLVNLKNISVEEEGFVVIDSTKLLVSHQTLSAENIVYMITQLPKMGVLSLLAHNTTPIPMHFPSKDSLNKNDVKNENLLIFTQRDIDDNLIHYKYTGAENTTEVDSFKFDVTNGITTHRGLTFYINIISKLITVFTGNITVTEGQTVSLTPQHFVVSNSFYASLIDEYLIIEEPKFGSIVCKDENDEQKVTKSFTPKLLREGLIFYAHDGSESTSDWLTIVVRVNSLNKESLPSTIHVIIEPINDEKPYVVNNTGLELWEGSSALITNFHLAAEDDDSTTEDIVYQISTPSNGYVTTIDNKQTPIERFSQIMIDSGIILFVQRGELGGGFRFHVTDGTLSSGPHVFVITTKPVVMSMTVNKKLFIFPRMQQSVTRDHLLVETNDGNHTRQFTYHVVREPRFGRFLLENRDGTTKYVQSFTQKQINENLVLYENNKPIDDILVEDQIIFDIESHFVQSLKGVLFTVEIAIGNSGQDLTPEMIKLIEVRPLSVIEGQFTAITENNLNISELINYWKKKDFNTKIVEKLYLKIQRNPFRGIILFEGQEMKVKPKNIALSALSNHQLIYKHDGSNTLNDSLTMAIYLSNGVDILLSNHTIDVNIIPVSHELPILLTSNPKINVVFDSKTLISNSLLRTSDTEGVPHNIIYELLTDPIITNTFGYFMIEPNEQPINSFTQFQIDSKLIYFKHKGLTSGEKQIKFRIKDEKGVCSRNKQCTEIYTFIIQTRQSSVQLVNHSTVELLQGSITAKIEPKHLSVVSNDIKPENIVFYIREGPINGYIIVNDVTNIEKFRQIDINSLKVSYIQINKSSNDFLKLDVMRVRSGQILKSIENITLSISVRPLVRAKKPFLIASPGYRSIITAAHLDASDLWLISNSVPTFRITSNPKFGYLIKFSDKLNKRVERKAKPDQLTEFTNDDLINGQIAYIADKELDLSYPNEIITDVIHYDLSANNVQTASGILVVNIVDKKLWYKSNNRDYGTNSSDSDDQMIEMLGENEEINYLNIIITRDHLLIAFVFIVVVILTVALIVIIRFCQSSPIQTLHKDSKSGPITSAINTNPSVLETPPISEYGAEMLMMSHRLSPRSTPSVSEMETGLMPMAPPTSPSLSTTCSGLETRSHTATPRSLLRLPMAGRLRGGCAAMEDPPQETSTCNIFPLPPPSLYFAENEPNMSPTDWRQSSIPLCRVQPIVPQCLQNHYHCSAYHQNICPFNQNSVELSDRVLGDGTSLVGSPIPSSIRTQWSSDELLAPIQPNNICVNPSPHYKNFLSYDECKSPVSPNSDIYITDGFSADSLGVQYDLEQTVPKQKQKYWV